MNKKILCMVIFLCVFPALSFNISTVQAETGETYGDFTYRIDDKTVMITGYSGTKKSVVIPSKIKGYVVKTLAEDLFAGDKNIESISLPSGLSAFGSDEGRFINCPNLKSIIVSMKNKKYSSRNGVLFNKKKTALLRCPETKSGTYAIPRSVKKIKFSAFWGCKKLKKVKFNKKVSSIGNSAFQGCLSLKKINIPKKIKSLGEWTFYMCKNLTKITFSKGFKSIDTGSFSGCKNLKQITLPAKLKSLGDNAFSNCGLTEISIPSTIKIIEKRAFSGCKKLSNVKMFDGLEEIQDAAFFKCSLLKKVTIPQTVKTIADDAFPTNCEVVK